MIQFNLNRFGKLAKWSLTNDKGYYVKSFLQVFVITTLAFIAFTTNFLKFNVNGNSQVYVSCSVFVIILIMVTVITGPAWMFMNEKGGHERQALLMLPASNFEKYLMRYSTWIILLPLYIAGFFVADLIQYLVNVVAGNEGVMFVTTKLMDIISKLLREVGPDQNRLTHALIAMLLWLNSFYALGGTFFRSHKFAWVLTTVTFIVLGVLWISVMPDSSQDSEKITMLEVVIWDVIFGAWFLLNFWLSYRLFCRQQIKGKFVNL